MRWPSFHQELQPGEREFRLLLVLLTLGNALLACSIWFWFPYPMTGFYSIHVVLAAATAASTAACLFVTVAPLVTGRSYESASVIVVVLQVLRLAPGSFAPLSWPGGDDGPLFGWEGLVIPQLWFGAIAGWLVYRWRSSRAMRVALRLIEEESAHSSAQPRP